MASTKRDRTEPPAEVVRIDAPTGLAALAEDDKSTDVLQQYRILPRITLVQGQSAPELKEKFGEGAMILQPGQVALVPRGGSIRFHPLFFFVEYCLWSDIRDKANARILARSFDPGSDLAARSRDRASRNEAYAGGPAEKPFERRYVEHLNFAGLVYLDGHDANMTSAVLGFSRGEYTNGQNFGGAILRRKLSPDDTRGAPLWMQIWEITAGRRTKDAWNWFGFDYAVPQEQSLAWVSVDQAPIMKQMHLELVEQHTKKVLVVDRRGEDESETAEPGAVETGTF